MSTSTAGIAIAASEVHSPAYQSSGITSRRERTTFHTVGHSAKPQLAAPTRQKCGTRFKSPATRGHQPHASVSAHAHANVTRAAGTGSNAVQYAAQTATHAVPAAAPHVSDNVCG